VQTPNGWRIDRLPNGVFLDWQQFQAAYKRYTLYFVDPTGVDGGAGPALCRGVRTRPAGHRTGQQADRRTPPGDGQGGAQPARPAAEACVVPVTRADGGKTGVGRGYGGARIDLEGLVTTDPGQPATCLPPS